MKKINSIFSLLLVAMAFVACTPEVEDKFDKSASQRAADAIAEAQKVLEAAPNGWRMEYYGSSTYGGYNVFVKFKGDQAEVGSEKVGASHQAGVGEDGKIITETSHIKYEQSQGIIVSFDDFNNIMHYFSTPDNPDYGEKGTGMDGDFEFRIISATPEKVTLRGKKHNSRIDMYPMPADQSWADYVQKVKETEEFMASRAYFLRVDPTKHTLKTDTANTEVTVFLSYRRLVFEYTDTLGESQQIVVPYVVTPEGFTFYSDYEVAGVTLNGLLKGDTMERFYAANDAAIWLETEVPPLWESLRDGMWFFYWDGLGSYAQPKWKEFWEKLKTAGPNKSKNTLYWAFIGNYQSKEAFHFQAGGDYGYQGLNFAPQDEEGTIVKITRKSTVYNTNGRTYYNTYALNKAMEPLVGSMGRTFRIETDNPRRPSYMRLVDLKESTNVITLSGNEVDLPLQVLDETEEN